MTDQLEAPLTIPEPLPETQPLPTISERRNARALRAAGGEGGLDLVPRVRPIGIGAVADILAIYRHNHRVRARHPQAA